MVDQLPPDKSQVRWANIRWLLLTFTTREHFIRFFATGIFMVTAYLVLDAERKIPEGWWGVFGVVVGYYFRGEAKSPPEPKAEDPDQH